MKEDGERKDRDLFGKRDYQDKLLISRDTMK